MALTFSRAVPVEKGQRFTSTQLACLAKAVNDRLRAFSFCSWRICWYWLNLFRQPRNPSSDGLTFPAQGEFFHVYQHLDPEHHLGSTWPETGPGEPEGANLANPMNTFVFGVEDPGNPAGGIDAEDVRINFGLPFLLTPTPTLEELWNLGKAQRGAYDPATGAQNTPAWDVANTLFSIQTPWWSPHGKALGGWLPTPIELLPDCGTTETTGLGTPSYELKWTGLSADVSTTGLHGTITTDAEGRPVVTYAGTCLCGNDNVADGHVIAYSSGQFGWQIAVLTDFATCTYAIDTFPIADWIEGPYTGQGALAHTTGNQLQRAMWVFETDFRGTPAQRDPDTFNIKRIAFDNQAFWTRQYALAPNLGAISGDSILALYPQAAWTATGNVPQGTFGTFGGEGTEHIYAEGFVLAGVFAKATGLTNRIQLSVLNNDQLLATIDLVPDDTGAAEAMTWLKNATRPDPLRIKLASDATFNGTGSLYCEATEQIEYKPQFQDAALLLRVGASQGGDQFSGGVDGRGRDTTTAKAIGDNYFAQGCLNTYLGVRSIAEWVNDNPVFDTARRLSRDHCRITRRQQLVSYEVTGGKSILRFKRFAQYPGIDGVEVRADCFADIAPPLDPIESGKLVEGETYIVRGSGSITYEGSIYTENETFTAIAPTTSNPQPTTYQTNGTAAVYVKDGIRHSAFKKGFTNEWTMFVEPRCYHPSPTSIWKPEAYSDYFTFCDRCHFYSGTAQAQLRRFSTFNYSTSLDADFNPILNPISLQAAMLNPEVPDQYRYANNANQTFGSAEFYSSCQVYNPPYEIESCIVDTDSTDEHGEQIIKITLTGRLRSHPNAPATVAADPLTWSSGDIDSLRNTGGTPEDYRTDDNAVREYVLSLANGNYPCVFRTGDSGTGSAVTGLPDNPFGSCYPVFFFGRLIPEPYDDGNDVSELRDSRCLIDSMLHMEVALRAMCEGFVDGRTSQEIICETGLGSLYDYTFENLCFEAFGGRWIGAFTLDKRDDNPGGFGPLPNTRMYADVFNRLVSAVNLLDKVRLDIPLSFKFRTLDYGVDTRPVTLVELNASTCSLASQCAAYGDGLPPVEPNGAPTVSAWSDWGGTSIGASKECHLDGCPYVLVGQRQDTEYRVEVDPAYFNAVPDAIQDLINDNHTGFLAIRFDSAQAEMRNITDLSGADLCPAVGGSALWNDGAGEYYAWTTKAPIESTVCQVVSAGILTAPSVPPSDYKIAHAIGEPGFCGNVATGGVSLTLVGDPSAFIQVPVL